MHVTLVEPGNVKTDFTASRRMARAAGGDPVYGAALAKAVSLMERDEANGVPAADVAAVVRRVLRARPDVAPDNFHDIERSLLHLARLDRTR